MSYVVLARKWRPNQFDEVVGQGHVARTLKNAIEQDRVAHAFLFAGPRGVGKTSTARILAKALNCKEGPTTTPCDKCVACVEITKGQAVDVFEIDGASNRGINEIRDLRDSVRYAPSRDEYKIYIIDEVHMLTTEAFNALLKTLEEPPSHAKFVFATTEPQKIPVTILSRCQRYDFKRVGQHDIVQHLENICASESIEAEKGALQIIARQAAGGMRDALSLLDQIISFSEGAITEAQVGEVLGVANRRQLFELSGAVIERDAERALRILDDVNRYGYDLSVFAGELVSHFRDLTVVKVVENPTDVTDLTDSEIESMRAQVSGTHANLLQRYFAAMAEATQELTRSSFPKLVFEMTLVRLTQLEPLDGIDLLVNRLRALEEEFDGSPPTQRSARSENPSRPQSARTPEVQSPTADARPTVRQVSEAPRETLTPPTSKVGAEAPKKRPSAAPSTQDAVAPSTQVASTPTLVAPSTQDASTPPSVAPSTQDTPDPGRPAVAPSPPAFRALASTPHESWRAVVAHLHTTQRPLAMTCEHAFVERFQDGVVSLSFADKYIDIIREPGRVESIQSAVGELYGGTWRVMIGNDVTEVKAPRTLSKERDDEIKRRLQTLESELRNHSAIREAQSLFEVDPEAIRVQVKLFDED